MVMHPVVLDELFRQDHLERLARTSRLVSPEPYRDFESLEEHLPRVEVLVTSWGCPPVNAEVIDQLPRLQLIAHLAGSVKGFLDDVVWRRGIRVTNAVAAILFMGWTGMGKFHTRPATRLATPAYNKAGPG